MEETCGVVETVEPTKEECRGNVLGAVITREEIVNAKGKARRGKATGDDRIPNEFLKE